MDVGELRARLTLSSDDFNRGMNQARNQMDQTSRSAERTKEAFDKIQRASAAFAGVVGGIFAASIGTAATFEQKMKDVQAISGESADNMKKLSDLAIDMGNKTAFSASEAADGIQELVKAGISVTDILNGGLQGALDLATAGGLSLADAAQAASTALNAFRKDGLSVADAANILAGAANASATDVSEMQQGLSQVSAVAAGAGLSFRDTSIALAAFAQFGLRGSDAGTSLKTMLLNLTPNTKSASEEMVKLGLETKNGSVAFYDAQGHVKSMADIAQILHEKLGKLTDQQRQQALQTMFGTDALRAANILYEQGAQGINDMWTAMSKVTAADVAATKMQTLKGAFDNLRSSLETIGIKVGQQFLPMLTQITRAATDVVGSLDNVKLANIEGALAFGGTAAAIAFVGSTAMKLITTLRLLLPAMGPAGWLILGVSVLGGYLAQAAMSQKVLDDTMLDNLKTQLDSAKAIDANVQAYDDLRMKAHLTNDEFAQFVDLGTELQKTTDTQRIAQLTAEQDQLRQKSGLSNEELDRMVKLNGDLVQKVPEATKTITDQGNAIVNNTDAIKKYSAAKLDSLYKELDLQRLSTEKQYNDLLKQEGDLIDKRKAQQEKLQDLQDKQVDAKTRETDAEQKLKDMQADSSKYSQAALDTQIQKVAAAKQEVEGYEVLVGKQAESLINSGKDLDNVREKMQKLQGVRDQMAQIVLQQAGLNSKVGEELSTIDSAIGKLQAQKDELQKTTPAAQRNTDEYRNAVSAIDSQIVKLQNARDQVINITNRAAEMNAELSKDITKRITEVHYQQVVEAVSQGRRMAGGPQSSEFHTGGIVGRGQMPKLHVGGLASQFLANTPNHNEVDVRLLKNEMILTQAQQANLMRMIDAGFTQNSGQQAKGKTVNYNTTVHAQKVDVTEDDIVKTLQRLEALYGG